MPARLPPDFLSGVIEGFYGPPWLPVERKDLLGHLVQHGLNTYFYGPKDDLKHRSLWRQCYAPEELIWLSDFVDTCIRHHIRFIYALAPGLDICYSNPTELEVLKCRCHQLLAIGIKTFAILFDDIPDRLSFSDQQRWPSPAAAQAHVANQLYAWLQSHTRETRLLFCPTPYCERMVQSGLGGPQYLEILGRELHPPIDIFWTGPEIISREISLDHIQCINNRLRRPPVIWDNLHANDYDSRRFYCGPYSGRPLELRNAVRGILSNPNCEFPLNFIPLRTLGRYLQATDIWDEREEYLQAMRAWHAYFDTVGAPIDLDDLVRFGDCHYLPYSNGLEGDRLLTLVRGFLAQHPTTRGGEVGEFLHESLRWRTFFTRMTELRHRTLYHALSRRIWDLREEIDLLARYVEFKSQPGNADLPFRSDYHLPFTHRGGIITDLQNILRRREDGSLAP